MTVETQPRPPGYRVGHRPAALALASVCALTLLAGIAGAFHDASRLDWLVPSETNVAAVEGCHKLKPPQAQRQCLQQVVATAKARHSLSHSVARSDSPSTFQDEGSQAR